MILYFKEKSKKPYLGGVLFLISYLVCLYIIFIQYRQQIQPITIQIIHANPLFLQKENKMEPVIEETLLKGDYAYIASSKGKYYYPKNCAKAKALSVKNMLFYKDKMTAEKSGYLPYLSCF